MSRVMLHGVLNMPAELWDSSNPFDSMQRQYTYFEASKLIFKQDDMIADLEKKLSLRAKRINAAIDIIDSDSEDCKFEAVSILSGENDEALEEQE